MAEYIDRNKLLDSFNMSAIEELGEFGRGCLEVIDSIKYEEAAEVAPVRHGRWIKRGYACGENEYECSVCHETECRTSASRMKYCMFCGARMDGGESNG